MRCRPALTLLSMGVLLCAAACTLQKVPDLDIWAAAAQGDVRALEQHVAIGTDLDSREPAMGGTPLIIAASLGQTEAVQFLVEHGAPLETRNNDGTTAVIGAAFFAQPEALEVLLESGADPNAKGNAGLTPLATATAKWTGELAGIYTYLGQVLQLDLDLERIQEERPVVADLLREYGGTME